VLMLTTPQRVCAKDGDGDQEIMAIATISDINNLLNTISLYTMLEIDVSTNVVFRDKYLIPFGNYLDYQWVGAGKTAYLYPSKIASFIAEKINTGTPPENVARLVINAFQEGLFSVDVGEPDAGDANKLRVGAYFVGGYDIFQNPAGEVETHFEINQSKFYFSGHYNPDKSNRNVIDFLAEFNPVPEEVYHHIDFLRVNHGSYYDTLVRPSDEEGRSSRAFCACQFQLRPSRLSQERAARPGGRSRPGRNSQTSAPMALRINGLKPLRAAHTPNGVRLSALTTWMSWALSAASSAGPPCR
jgi:hypothetical protein